MEDRRFDALAKAVASGTNRRRLLKGVLGIGGIAIAGGPLLNDDALAARRPTPTPKPPTCPGQQVPCATGCCCPAGLETCGSTCCTEDSIPAPLPGHSECCDGACCAGTCYGEELCCATNNRDGELPPLEHICASTDGTQCCGADQLCCQFDGCCDTICWGGDEFCCPEEAFCRGGGEAPDVCCVNSGSELFACCNGGTDSRVCYDTSVEGACCTDADCGDPCLVCNPETNICGPRCDTETEHCCGGECSELECEPSTQCSSDYDCGGDIVCCVGDCCTQGQSCVTDPNNNSYCE